MKKIRFWEIWDWKSISCGFVWILFLTCLFIFLEKYPDYVRNKKSSNLISIVEGEVLSIKAIEGLSQSEYTGNRTTRDYNEVDYAYKVNGQTYFSGDRIPNSLRNKNLINKLLRSELKTITVRYDPSQPNKSQVVIEN